MKTATLALMAAMVAAIPSLTAAPLTDINQYADRCAAELGAGTGAYMPLELLPAPGNFSDTREVPVFWNRRLITFEETDPATGARMPGSNHWEFLFDGRPGAAGFPDGANTVGRITQVRRDALKCDYWSHVNTTVDTCVAGANAGRTCRPGVAADCPGSTCTTMPTGCFPGQRILRRDVGTCSVSRAACNAATPCGAGQGTCIDVINWSAVLRRQAPPKPGQAAFDPFHSFFFNNFDVIALKADTGGVCWFDTLFTGTLQVDKWWEAAPGTPPGVPRPGGRDTAKKARAQPFWMSPASIQHVGAPKERCPTCHGNGPILASRWINQGNAFRGRNDTEHEIPYWHPAKLFDDPLFKTFGTRGSMPARQCGRDCHAAWSVSAETMPGGELANAMVAEPAAGTASHYRRQLDDMGAPFAKTCSGGAKHGAACTADLECDPGTCEAGQRAGILREMPHPFLGTPADWTADVLPQYTAMDVCRRRCNGGARATKACAGNADCPGSTCRPIDPAACTGVARATIPTFFGAQNAPPAGTRQLIQPPYVAAGVNFLRHMCVVAADGSETCRYQVQWRDPTDGESDYHAADKYYIATHAVANDPAQTPATARFCAGTTTEATATATRLAGSNWAHAYVAEGALAACRKSEFRLCGGYAFDSAAGASDAHSPVDSRNDGDLERATLITACANPIKVSRSGFRRHRATGRYAQTVTLKNDSAAAVAGPVTLLLFGLSANATLWGGGRTVAVVPAGTPYVSTAHSGIAAGASVILQIEFTNPTNQGITYESRVRTGPDGL